MACELVTLSDDRVKRFGDSRLYLICGKVISLWTDGIDMSDPKDPEIKKMIMKELGLDGEAV